MIIGFCCCKKLKNSASLNVCVYMMLPGWYSPASNYFNNGISTDNIILEHYRLLYTNHQQWSAGTVTWEFSRNKEIAYTCCSFITTTWICWKSQFICFGMIKIRRGGMWCIELVICFLESLQLLYLCTNTLHWTVNQCHLWGREGYISPLM